METTRPTDGIVPERMAAEMRRRAHTLDGPHRDHFLWLAAEWDRTASRFGSRNPIAADGELYRRTGPTVSALDP